MKLIFFYLGVKIKKTELFQSHYFRHILIEKSIEELRGMIFVNEKEF